MKGFKKAFTIVELVIVIAVIAILAAVLIPTFSNIIRKANISNDTQLVRNLNTALVVDRAVNGEHKTMQSALDAAFDAGYDLAKINARANQNEILWDSKNDVFCYYNDDTKEIEYIPEFPGHDPVGQNEQYLFWKIYSATPEAQKYSIYWNSNSNFTPSLKVGFDAGKSTGVTSLNYVGSGSAQDVVIRTNSFDTTLTINAPKDTVKHYGKAEKVDVVAIANASYHENGTVQLIAVKEGHVKLEGDADVNGVYVYTDNASAGFEDIKITVDAGVEIPTLSRSAVVVQEGGTKVCTVVTDQAKDIYLFNEGIYEQIKTVDEGKNIATDASAKWADDDNANTANTQNAAQQLANEFNGSYDGNGKIADQIVEVTGDNAGTYTVKFNQDTREFETYQGDTKVTETTVVEAVTEVADVASDSGKTAEEAEFIATAFASGSGTENDPFLIATTEQWMNISYIYKKTGETVYYKVIADLNFANQDPYVDTYEYEGAMYEDRFYCYTDDATQDIHLDLNNHTLSNVDYPLFNLIYHLDIANGKIGYSGRYGAITDSVSSRAETSLNVHDLVLYGTIDTNYSHFGPVVSYCYGKNTYNCTVTLENIDNQLKITNAATSSYTGGFIGYIQGSKASLIVKNCTFSGSIQGMYVGGFVGGCSAPNGSPVVSESNKVNGSLLGSTSAMAFGLSTNVTGGSNTVNTIENGVTVPNTATIRTISSDATLVSTSIGYGEEFVINHTNSNVAYYTATLSFNIDMADGSSGGYPRDIMFTIETADASSYNTGLFKCYIESSATNNSTSENLVLNQSGVVVWKVGDTYYVYSDAYKLSTNGKAYLYIYGYDVDGGLVTYINASYASVK